MTLRRIIFILPYLFRMSRGIERSGSALASQMASAGHEVTIFAWDYPPPHPSYDLHPSIKIRRVPNFRYFRDRVAGFFYSRWLLAMAVDEVVVYFADLGEAVSLRRIRAGDYPRVHFIAGYPIESSAHRFHAFRRLGLEPLLHAIIAKSPSNATGISQFFRRKVHVIPNGIDLDAFDPGRVLAATLPDVPDEAEVVLTVAALEERKGIHHVIRGLARLREIHPDREVHYLVAGEGPYRDILADLVYQLGLTGRIHLPGNQPDVRPWYKRASLFALLSEGEGFPNVLLEAWAMENLALTSTADPFPAIVPPDCGQLVPATDAAAVAEALARALDKVRADAALGPRIRRHVTETYAWPTIATRYAAAFAGEPSPACPAP